MKQHKLHLDLENSVNKINRDKINAKLPEKTTEKVTLQGNDLPRAMEARPCQEGCKQLKMTETEAPCRKVV